MIYSMEYFYLKYEFSIKIIKSFDFRTFFYINLCTFSDGIYYRQKM